MCPLSRSTAFAAVAIPLALEKCISMKITDVENALRRKNFCYYCADFFTFEKRHWLEKVSFLLWRQILRGNLESSTLTDASKVFSHWIFLKLFPWWIIKIPCYLSGWKKNRLLWNLYARLRLINLPAPTTTPERREERIERNCLWNSPCAFLFGNVFMLSRGRDHLGSFL